MRRVIEVVDHDAAWRQRYAELAARVQRAAAGAGVGDDIVAIEHVGSTAVPGLAAKPIVDAMVGLGSWPPRGELVEALEQAGLRHHGEQGIPGRSFFCDAELGQPRSVHLHAVEHGGGHWTRNLAFRDHLREHPEDVARYEAAKREAAGRASHDPVAYAAAKHDVIREILRRALGDGADVPVVAAVGFQAAADAYERSRPGYPPAAVDHVVEQLGLAGAGTHLVEVGAGTGKLTRLVARDGLRITAVEPLSAMRARLADLDLPGVEVHDGVGEDLPVATAGADALVAAQAFHWVDPWLGLAECHRVLRDGGRIALVWNVRDESVPWVARWTDIIETVSGDTPRERFGTWRRAAEATSTFTDPVTTSFPWEHVVDRASMMDRVASISFVAALHDDRRREVLDRFGDLLDTDPATAGRDRIAVPYRTEVHVLERRQA